MSDVLPPDPNAPPQQPAVPQIAQPSAANLTQANKDDAQILGTLRDQGRQRRKSFIDIFDRIEHFSYGSNYDKLLYSDDESMSSMRFKAKINRASEFAEIGGTFIFPKVPDAQVNSRDWALYWARKRHAVEQNYLKYALWEGDYHLHVRKQVTEALLSGRSGVFTGFNADKGIVQNVFRSCRDFLMDSAAKCAEEINWVAIKRTKPKWELKAHLQQVRKDNEMDAIVDGLSIIKEDASQPQAGMGVQANDIDSVDYYEFYFCVGLWRFGQTSLGLTADESGQSVQDDSPRKFYWVPGQVLAVSGWEMPLYMINEWPIGWVDFRPRPNHLWPAAPMETGLTHLETLNFMYTFYVNRIRFAWRTFLVAVNYNGTGVSDDELMKLVYSGDFSFLRVRVTGDEHKFNDLVQQFKFDSGIDEFERAWALVSSEFAKSTGLSDIMYSGEGATQSRVTADVEFKKSTSSGRFEDMRQLNVDHMSRVMRKTLFAARFIHTPEEIAKLLGAEAGAIWGTLASPEQVAAEQQQRTMMKQQRTQQAQLQRQGFIDQIAKMPPPMVAPGMMPPPPPVPPPIPTDDELEAQLGPPQFVAMADWVHEAERTVDAGTTVAMDRGAKMDALNSIIANPAIPQMPGGTKALAVALMEMAKLQQLSHDMQSAFKDMVTASSAQPAPLPNMPSAPNQPGPVGHPPGTPSH